MPRKLSAPPKMPRSAGPKLPPKLGALLGSRPRMPARDAMMAAPPLDSMYAKGGQAVRQHYKMATTGHLKRGGKAG